MPLLTAYNRQAAIVSKLRIEQQAAVAEASEAADQVNKNILAEGEAYKKQLAARKLIEEQIRAEQEVTAQIKRDKDAVVLQRAKDSAQSQLEIFTQLNATELEQIDNKEQQRLDKLNEYRDQELISLADWREAKKAIEAKADADETKLFIENKQKQVDADKLLRDEKIAVLDSTTQLIKNGLGEQSALYKAAAIVNATVKTYESATAAYNAALKLGPVGIALAPVVAGIAVGAGLANVRAIASAREQGGTLNAGQDSTFSERGQLEILTPSNSSRVRTAQQMKSIMGESSNSSPVINVVNIDQSTGGVSVETSTDDDGRIINLIRDTVSNDNVTPNSQIAKSVSNGFDVQVRR